MEGGQMRQQLIIQQGDCVIKRCGVSGYFKDEFSAIPKTAKPVKSNLVLKGTTNAHALYGGKFQLYKDGERIFIDVKKPTKLDHVQDHTAKKPKHAEHHAQEIPVGQWFVDELLEYDHMLEESRRVID
jgi:hypothetical protein